MLSFYEIKSFTRAPRNTDHEVSVPKCPGKCVYFINQGQLFKVYVTAYPRGGGGGGGATMPF